MSHLIAPLVIKYRRAKGIVQFPKDYPNLRLVKVHSKQQQEWQQEADASTTATTATSTSCDNKKVTLFQWTRSRIF